MKIQCRLPQPCLLVLLISILLLQGCSNEPDLGRFNAKKWKNDHDGCKGLRETEFKSLELAKDKLKGLSETSVAQLLGHPNRNELRERGVKSYVYIISGGSACSVTGFNTKVMVIDFDVLNRLTLMSTRIE